MPSLRESSTCGRNWSTNAGTPPTNTQLSSSALTILCSDSSDGSPQRRTSLPANSNPGRSHSPSPRYAAYRDLLLSPEHVQQRVLRPRRRARLREADRLLDELC